MFSQPVPLIRKLSEASYPYPSEYRQKEQELQPHSFLNENYHHRKLTEMITWVTALCARVQARWSQGFRRGDGSGDHQQTIDQLSVN